jgi:segregation and condensation protein A
MRPTDLELDIDSFSGPFDLLCTVLLRRELELSDVRLAEVVVGYVQRLSQIEEVDPDTASEFLVLMAALMEIKVRTILAADEEGDLGIEEPAALEAEHEMFERLVRYATFKGAAEWLGSRGQRKRYWRVASRPTIRRRATYDGPAFDPTKLKRSIDVLLAQPDVDVRHLVGRHASVGEMASRLLTLLAARRNCTFDEVIGECSRLDQAVAFVAMLELCRSGRLNLEQEEPFGTINIERVLAGETPTHLDAATEAAEAGSMEIQIA